MSKVCVNENSEQWQDLVDITDEITARKIYRDAGNRIPTGDHLASFIERENTQEAKLENLNDRERVEGIINNLSDSNIEVLPNQEGYLNKETGEKFSRRVSMLVKDYQRSMGRFFNDNNTFYAKKGTVIHEYQNYLTSNIAQGNTVSYSQAIDFVKKLKQFEEFKNESDNFFTLEKKQFDLLKQVSTELIEDIKNVQKSIDPKGEVHFFNEIPIADEYRDLAGTVDLLAVFSDGSASMYDFKTFSQRDPSSPHSNKIGDWDVQLSNYRNMLRDNYGINRFRHTRAIPIRTRYEKYVNGKWVNEVADGFQVLSAKTKTNDLDYLDPIPFQEDTGDERLNSLLENIRNKIKDLDTKIAAEYLTDKKIRYKRQKERLTKALNDLSLNKDTQQLFDFLRHLAKTTKNRLSKSKIDEDYINEGELTELYHELKIYDNIATDLSNQLDSSDVKDKKKRRYQALEAQKYINDLMKDINAEVLDRMPSDIQETGHIPANRMSRMMYGIGNWDQPVFRELKLLWRRANEITRVDTLKDIDKIQKADKAFSDWAKKNGYGAQEKFTLLMDDNKNLYRKFTDEFYDKKEALRKKAKDSKLSPEDKAWLGKNFEIDEKAFAEYYKNFLTSIKDEYDLERTPEAKKIYEEKMAKFKEFSDPRENKENIYRHYNFEYMIPKENVTEYISDEWKFIQSNEPVKEYYNTLTGYIDQWVDVLGRDQIGENFIPNIEQDIISNLLEHGKKNVRESFLKKFELRENDAVRGRMVDGKSVASVPIMYIDKLRHNLSDKKKAKIEDDVSYTFPRGSKEFKEEVEKRIRDKEYQIGLDAKSTDLTKSFMLFAHSVNEFVNLSEVEPTVKALKFLVDTEQIKQKVRGKDGKNLVNRFTGSVIKKMGFDPELNEIFDTFVNRLIYKQKFNEELFSSDKYSSNKIISALMQWLSIRALGFNLIISGANFIQGKTGMYMAAKEGLYFDRNNLKDAYKAFNKHEDQYLNTVEYLMPTTRDLIRERIELSGASFASRRLRSRTFFLGHIKGDDAVDHSLTVAMSKRWVVDSDGRIKNPESKTANILNTDAPSVYDSIKVNEEGETYIPGLSIDELANFRAKVQKQAYKIKGMMSEEQKGVYASSMLMTMFMQFRSWSVGLSEARFSELKYDPTMEEYEIGRFNAALGGFLKQGAVPALKEGMSLISEIAFMGLYKPEPNMERIRYKYDQFIAENPEHKGNFTIEQFMKLQKDKLNGFLAEARVYVSFIVLAQLLAGLDWDDEEESNLFTWNAYQVSRRSLLELSFWFNPGSVDEIVRSPLPLWGLFGELSKIVNSTVREASFAVEGERDPRVTTSPQYYMLKSTPGVNQVLGFMKFFEEYNPPKTTTDYIFDMFDNE